ncbi:hypothetical protein AC249_AIPGENE5425 [Exaiptasia diaphana]|nr:hypothetical protein AC249_AIPGENE5425 [Exaiptasia diaphana]
MTNQVLFLTDNQANANKTNKLGAVATNELNNTVGKTEGGRSGSSEQFDIDECEPCALGKNASKNVKHQTKVAIIQHDSSEKEVFNEDVNKYAASSFSDHSSCSDVDSSSSPVDKVSKLHKIREDIESQRDEVKNLLDPEIMTEVKDIVTSIKKDGKCQNSPTDDLLKELEKWYKLVEAKEDWSDTRNALQEREESHRLLDKRPFYDVGQQDLARKLIDDRCAHLLLLIDNQLRKPSAEFAV